MNTLNRLPENLPNNTTVTTNAPPRTHNTNKTSDTTTTNNILAHTYNTHKTYVDIFLTKTSTKPPTPMIIHSCPDLVKTLSHSIIGELHSIDTFTNLHTIFCENGFPNIRIKYLGGLHVLIELETDITLEPIFTSTTIMACFNTFKPWDKNFLINNRLTWISIEGLPPQA